MTDFPGGPTLPLFIGTNSGPAVDTLAVLATGQGSAAAFNPVEKRALYIPVILPYAYPVQRVWWTTGSTTTSSNNDFGIYTAEGKRLYSTGSTALGTANGVTYVTPTAFLLPAGVYYFALLFVSGTVTNRWFGYGGTATAAAMRSAGIREQGGITSLPESATFATAEAVKIPYCGITRTASGF